MQCGGDGGCVRGREGGKEGRGGWVSCWGIYRAGED